MTKHLQFVKVELQHLFIAHPIGYFNEILVKAFISFCSIPIYCAIWSYWIDCMVYPRM